MVPGTWNLRTWDLALGWVWEIWDLAPGPGISDLGPLKDVGSAGTWDWLAGLGLGLLVGCWGLGLGAGLVLGSGLEPLLWLY